MKSQEQEYMLVAHGFVENANSLSDSEQKDYTSRVKSAPVLIHDTGLMQTLAFYISKDEKSLDRLATHLLTWLNYDVSWKDHLNDLKWELFTDLMNQIQQSPEKLMMNTEKTLKLLQWLKRFSESQLKHD